jgi:hypothetical protein
MIHQYFTEDRAKYAIQGIVLYVFDDTRTTAFVTECLIPFRRAYLSDEKLCKIEAKKQNPREDIIKRRLPDPGDVMSGDFGEILTYYMATELWSPDVNYKPMKWRFKDDPKKASPKTDVILFRFVNDVNHPDANDRLITYEIKAHAKPISGKYKVHAHKRSISYKDGKDCCTFIDAVFDADRDRASRAAESIIYLKNKAEDEDNDEFMEVLKRFDHGYSTPYNTQYNAVAVIESTDIDNQISRMPSDLMTTFPDIVLYCMPIKNLQQVYEAVYSQLGTT